MDTKDGWSGRFFMFEAMRYLMINTSDEFSGKGAHTP